MYVCVTRIPGSITSSIPRVFFLLFKKKKDVWYMKYIIDIKIHFEIYYITYMHPAKAPLSDNLLLIKLNQLSLFYLKYTCDSK